MPSSTTNKQNNSDAISLDQLMHRLRLSLGYIKSKLLVIFFIAIIGAIIGLCYVSFKKNTYSAVCSFVLDAGNKEGGLGQYAGLASLAGVSLDNGGGLFEGDNILELYKSRTMIEKTLLSTATFNGKSELLIERYITAYNLRERWRDKDGIKDINFNGDPGKFNRTQDSIITDITKQVNKKYLNVSKPDKKLSIILVEVKSNDELFAKEFANKIVENVNTFYVQTKTKKSTQNVQILTRQADSVRRVLNSSISGVADALDAAPNANPQLLSLRVPSQKKQVDVQASTAVYSEIVKNLEISKISLSKETPLIQLIDTPVLPLDNNKITKLVGAAGGFILFAFLGLLLFFTMSFRNKTSLK
ncbi:lipopolysaccharide biosynthesis protein [Mucilaginibacter sp.]|uniref:lipopolysaccharide biosynthesis protein n=1 Tax=Mucilaginibacter sp. TaxID=1882438 RepID=UPI003D0C4B00